MGLLISSVNRASRLVLLVLIQLAITCFTLYSQCSPRLVEAINEYDTEKLSILFAKRPGLIDSIPNCLLTNNDRIALTAHLNIADAIAKSDRPGSALIIYMNVIDKAESAGDSTVLFNALLNTGKCYTKIGADKRSIEVFMRSYFIAKLLQDQHAILKSMAQIANAEKALGLTEKSIETYKKCLELAISLADKDAEASLLNNLGSAYKKAGSYAQAKEFILRAIDMNKTSENFTYLSINYNNLANIYEEQHDLESALFYHNESLKIKLRQDDFYGLAVSYGNLSLVYQKLNNLDYALKAADQSIDFAHTHGFINLLIDGLKQKALILSRLNDLSGAYSILLRSTAISDSLNELEKQALSISIDSEYTKQRIQVENRVLKKEMQDSEEQLIKKDLLLLTISASLVLIFLVLILYFISHRSRTEAMTALQHQATSLSDLEENIESQKINLDKALKKLSRVSKELDLIYLTIKQEIGGPLSLMTSTLDERSASPSSFSESEHKAFGLACITAHVDMINDYVVMKKTDLRFECKSFYLSDLIQYLERSLIFISSLKQLDFVISNNCVNPSIIADERRLKNMLFMLLHSSIKHSREGFVKLQIDLNKLSDGSELFVFTIEDSGIGVLSDLMRYEGVTFTSKSGTDYEATESGFGVFISRILAEAMNGSVSITSYEHGNITELKIPYCSPL